MQTAMRMLGQNRYHPYVIVSDDRQQQHRSKSLGRCEEDQPKRFGKLKSGKALRGDVAVRESPVATHGDSPSATGGL